MTAVPPVIGPGVDPGAVGIVTGTETFRVPSLTTMAGVPAATGEAMNVAVKLDVLGLLVETALAPIWPAGVGEAVIAALLYGSVTVIVTGNDVGPTKMMGFGDTSSGPGVGFTVTVTVVD